MLNSQFYSNIDSISWDITHIPETRSLRTKIKPTNQQRSAEPKGVGRLDWSAQISNRREVYSQLSIRRGVGKGKVAGGRTRKFWLSRKHKKSKVSNICSWEKCDSYSPVYCFYVKAKPLLNRICFPPCAGFEGDRLVFSLLETHILSRWSQNKGSAPLRDKHTTWTGVITSSSQTWVFMTTGGKRFIINPVRS